MNKSDLRKLVKIEERICEIARENGLKFCDIEFDVVPEQKMFEMMAYGMPGQISNWKFGRDFEKTRTIYERSGHGLPMEVVFHTNPSRAYLMQNNSFAVQSLIIAHVVAHVAFFTMNKYYVETDSDLSSKLAAASKRFDDYEKKYGIELTEATVDAGHSIMFHSSPFESIKTEDEKLEFIFEREKKKAHDKSPTEYGDMFDSVDDKVEIERERFNHNLYMGLKNKTPIEPTEDFLRYIIDNARNLAAWQKDILEIIRQQGQYYYPFMRTKYMNEGFATYWHEFIMRQLYKENLLKHEHHAETNYSNSLVKLKNPFSMNPYLIGCEIWSDIVKRWNKGQHGEEWESITDHETKMKYDDKSMRGHEKMLKVLRTYTDWMFMNNYLTTNLVRELKLYIYIKRKDHFKEQIVITDKDIKETRDLIIKSFSHSSVPKIFITNGNFNHKGDLLLNHDHVGIDLHPEYAQKTLDHIAFLWNSDVYLDTKVNDSNHRYVSKRESGSVSSNSTGSTISQSS